ncbi:MAG TPA: mandelate racemase/muconate lactonizing enzyme family protein, partial [Terriglobales bacterium]|nr:mandelate racemase/muconate lactonizing enzyme family protein [Terriglobales bacterium]
CNVVDEALAPLLVGEDPSRIDAVLDRIQRVLMIWGRRGLAMFALAGVDLALWDLAGKALGVPVWRLLGGRTQPRVRAYGSLLRYATPSDVGVACAGYAAAGFTALKLHQVDLESVAVARDAVGEDVELMLDTNCPWTVDEAIAMARRLEPLGLRWLEEPVWPPEDYAGLARVRAATTIPLAAGENDATAFAFRDMIRTGATDIVQPSMTKVGGLSEMRKIAVLAATANVTLAPHSFYYGPGLAATVHFAVATPGVPYVEFPSCDLEAPLLQEPVRCVDGHVSASDAPGLGADPNPDVLGRYAYRPEAAKAFVLN